MTSSNYILLVEDNEDDIDLTRLALRKNQITNEVVVARNGLEAVETFKNRYTNNKEWPSLVLLDLNMPVSDGFEVLKEIKGDDHYKKVPVVILTSSGESEDVKKGYDLGANSYIRKPVSYSDFKAMVKEIGRYWLNVNIPPELNNAYKYVN